MTALERLADGRWKPCLILTALCLLMFLPGIAVLPPVDRDEARYAQATRQMRETGDYIQIRFQDRARNKKPIGIYWLQAVSLHLFGDTARARIWPFRVPSILGATAAVLATFAAGTALFDRKTALLAAVILATCALLGAVGRVATTDAVLLAATTVAQACLAAAYAANGREKQPGWGIALGFWTAQGAGVLIKGPITPLVSLATVAWVAVSERSLRRFRGLRPWAGLPLMAAIVCPWFLAVSRATEGAFLRESVGKDLLPKLISGQESHGAPPGYYLLLAAAAFWPASLLAPRGLFAAWKNRHAEAMRFCLGWLIPIWLLFELIPTKLPHYVLPIYPALALLTASEILRPPGEATPAWQRWTGRTVTAIWALVTLVLSTGLFVLPWWLTGNPAPAAIVPLAAGLALLVAAWRWRRNPVRLTLAGALTSLVILTFGAQGVLPSLDPLWLSRAVARQLDALKAPGPVRVATTGYREPSLVFQVGTRTDLTSPSGAVEHLINHPDSYVLVRDSKLKRFMDFVNEAGIAVVPVWRVEGVNYSNGSWMQLTLYRRQETENGQ